MTAEFEPDADSNVILDRLKSRVRAAMRTRDLRVLALVTDAFGGYGGIAQYNRDFLTALARRPEIAEIDVAVRLAPLPSKPLDGKISQRAPRATPLAYALHASGAALRKPPHVIFNGHLFHGPLAIQLARASGAALISQLHGTEVWEPLAPKHLGPLKQSDLILCVSRDTRRRLLEQAPELHARAVVLPNMVGAGFAPGDRTSARQTFGLAGQRVIVTVARLDGRAGYKGHDRIIRAMPRLLKERGDVLYVIAGDGPDRGRLERLAGELGVAGAVRFLGLVEPGRLPDLYRASDVFAMPSTGEGFGIVYLEAMACGIPAIGVDVGGVRDAMMDGALGKCPPMEAFEDVLSATLAEPPPDPAALSRAVHHQFGVIAFQNRLGTLLAQAGLANAGVGGESAHVRH